MLVSQTELAALADSIAADPVKSAAWNYIHILADHFENTPPEVILGSNWGFTRLPAMGMMAQLGDEPLATASREKVREMVLHLAATEEVLSSGDDLDTAIRLHALLMGYDLAFDGASEAVRETAILEIRRYLEVMTTDFLFRRRLLNPFCSNHGIAVGAVLGMSELCLRGELPGDPLLAAARSLGDSLIAKGYDDLLGRDGSYSEGGLYLAYIHRFLIPYWEAALRLDGLTLWDDHKLRRIQEWVAYLLTPEGSGYFLNRNECSESVRPLALHGALWEWSQRRLPDPRLARWVRDHITGEAGVDFGMLADKVSIVLHHRGGAVQSPAEIFPPQGHFPDQGLYVWRDSWPGDPVEDSYHFTIQAGRYMGGHWQEDVGQVTLRAFGHRFAMDHGAGTQASETEAHNIPLVNGLGQHNAGSGIGTDGELHLVMGEGFCRALRVDMVEAYSGHSPFNDPDWPVVGMDWSWGYDGGNPLERADRWVLLFPPGQPGDPPDLYLLDDLRKNEHPYSMEWRLHFEEGLELEVDDHLYRITGPSGRLAARLLDPPPAETSWSLDTYDNGGPDAGSQVLSVHHTAVDGRWLWQMQTRYPGQADPPAAVERHPEGIMLTMGGEPFLERVLLCGYGEVLETSTDELNGRFAVREMSGGSERYALIAGVEYRREGELYIHLDPAGSATVAGGTVLLSERSLDFEIYAPEAVEVLAGGIPVPFYRDGDYIFSAGVTGAPFADGAQAPRSSWSLWVTGQGVGNTLITLQARGPAAATARLDLFDVQGRRVVRLHNGPLPTGGRQFRWDGRSSTGGRLPTGLYLARLGVGEQAVSAKVILLR